MKLIVNNTGVFLDNQKVRHVTKIDLIELMPGSPKVVALQLEVDIQASIFKEVTLNKASS